MAADMVASDETVDLGMLKYLGHFGLDADSTMWIPSFCEDLMRISRLWMPVESINGTLRMRIMRTIGLLTIEERISSSNLVATPKKNGPSISYTSTPAATSRTQGAGSVPSATSSCSL